MSSTPLWQVELHRLRLTMNVLEHLDEVLQFVAANGYNSMVQNNPVYEQFINDWNQNVGNHQGFGDWGKDTKAALQKLSLIEGNTLSAFGRDILANWDNQEDVKDAFAQQIIIQNGLWAFCHVLSHFSGRHKEEIYNVYKEFYQLDLAEEVQRVGAWNEFLEWLGMSNGNFEFNDDIFNSRLGISINEFDQLGDLDYNSKWLLLSLIRLSNGQRTPFVSGSIKEMFKQLTGKGTAQLTQSFVTHQTKLEENGWITTSPEQGGGNAREWTLTDSIILTFTENILPTLFANPNSSQVINALSMSYQEIVRQIDNPEPNATTRQKGETLEIFSAKIAWDLGVRNIRLNVLDTIERDVLGNITNPFFQRILIQCKNYSGAQPTIGMPEIIKEIGIASTEKFDTILFFSRNGFVGGTQADVDKRMQRTGIKIYLFDKEDIDRLIEDGNNLFSIMEEKIRHIEKVMEGTDPVPEGLSSLPAFRDILQKKGWIPPNENTN